MIVLDQNNIIESRADYGTGAIGFSNGVRIRSLRDTLDEILSTRVPVNDINDPVPDGKKKFVIRHWFQ